MLQTLTSERPSKTVVTSTMSGWKKLTWRICHTTSNSWSILTIPTAESRLRVSCHIRRRSSSGVILEETRTLNLVMRLHRTEPLHIASLFPISSSDSRSTDLPVVVEVLPKQSFWLAVESYPMHLTSRCHRNLELAFFAALTQSADGTTGYHDSTPPNRC